MGDRPAYQLAVSNFRSEVDDFDTWLGLFESAVKLAYNTADDATLHTHCKNWLSLKLDDEARTVYGNVVDATWIGIKKELKKLLVNPQDKYNWRARVRSIVWDGTESLHSLATRVKRNVDKYGLEGGKESEYFFRFRLALPPEYRKAIDLACGDDETECTIDNAKKVALRLQMANADAVVTASGTAVDRTVAFTGAAMSDDRLKSIEMTLQGIAIWKDNMEAKEKAKTDSDDKPRGYSSSRERYESRYPDRRSPNRDHGRDSGPDRSRRDSRDDRRGGDRYRSFSNDQRDHRRDDSRDHNSGSNRPYYEQRYSRPYQNGGDGRYSQDRGDSRGRSDRFGSRDRQYENRNDRYGSRDGGYNNRGRGYGDRNRRYDSRDRRPDSRDRRPDSSDRRPDSRDRRPGYRDSRPNSRDGQTNRDSRDRDNRSNRDRTEGVNSSNGSSSNSNSSNNNNNNRPNLLQPSYNSANMDAQVDFIAAALSEKHLRDSQTGN